MDIRKSVGADVAVVSFVKYEITVSKNLDGKVYVHIFDPVKNKEREILVGQEAIV